MNNGKLAELQAIIHFTELGYEIFTPLGGCGSCDFIGTKSEEIVRVEVKSTTVSSEEKPVIDLRRQKNNTSSERTKFDGTKSDKLFAVNLNTGRHKVVDSMEYHGKSGIRV